MKKLLLLSFAALLFASCDCIHPAFMVWDSDKQAYVSSKWCEKQYAVFDQNVQVGEDGLIHLNITADEAKKAGVTKRVYKTFLYNIEQANLNICKQNEAVCAEESKADSSDNSETCSE